MKKRIDWLVLVLCLSVPLSLHAQSDSLHTVLNNAIKENVTIDIVNGYKQLGRFHEGNLNYDSAFYYYGQEGEYIKDNYAGVAYDTLIGKVYMDFSYVYLNLQQNAEAIKYLDSAEQVYKSANSPGNLVRVLNNRGMTMNGMNQYSGAVQYLLEALVYGQQQQEGDDKNAILNSVYINIGKSYIGLEDWPNAIKYTKKAIEIPSPVKLNNGHSHLNLSNVYIDSDSLSLAWKETEIAEAIYDSVNFVYGKIAAINNKGRIRLLQKDYEPANEYFLRAIEMSEEFQYPLGLIEAWVNRSEVLAAEGEYDLGIKEMLQAEELCKRYDDMAYLRNVKENLAELYKLKGDFKNAFKEYEQFKLLDDSIINADNVKSVNDLLIKYETAEKDLEIQKQKTTIASRNTQVTLLVSSLGLILLGGTLFYNRSKAKQKQQMQAAVIDEKERGLEAVVQATEEERKRISKDLHDGIGQQLNALKLGLTSVEKRIDGDLKNELSHIATEFTKSADDVRRISHQMMPRALMEDGLVKAVEDLLRNTFQYTDIAYDFEHHKMEERLDEKIEVSMYRILQELLSNIIKHAEATKVQVQLIRLKGKLTLLVEDNGKGFTRGSQDGHGQMNIRNRLDIIKGTVNYEPSPESGVVALITVPLNG